MADWPPLINAAFTVVMPIYDADGDPVSGAASLDSEVSIDGGAFTDCTAEASEIGTSGIYTLALTAGEMNGNIITVRIQTVTAGAKTAVAVMYTVTRQLQHLAFPTVAGRSIDVETTGEVGIALDNALGALGTAQFDNDFLTAALIANGAIDAATFAAGAIDAAAIANGAIDAATFAAGAIDAAAIATGAIDADALAADAITEIRSLVSGTSDAGGSATTMVDAARTEADDVWNGAWILFTSGAVANQVRLITDFVAASDTITFAPAATAAIGAGITYEILPAGAVDVQQWLESTVNALISGRVDVSVGAMQAGVIAAAAFAAGAIDAAAIATDAIGSAEFAQAAADKVWASAARTLTALGFSLANTDFAAGAIDAAAIANGAIDAATFAAGAIDAAAIAANAIGASELAADAATEIADAILARDIDQVEGSAALHSLCTAILKAVSRIRDNAGTLEVYRTNATTLHMSQAITTDAANQPIDELGVGS